MSSYTFVGSGIASLAGAVILLRDGDVAGKNITILEESHQTGGAFDAHGTAEDGYFMSGSRMFEAMYQCTFDLLDGIPSATDPTISVTEETNRAAKTWPWDNKVSLGLSYGVARLLARRSQPLFVEQWRWTGVLNGEVEENYSGHSLIKVFVSRVTVGSMTEMKDFCIALDKVWA